MCCRPGHEQARKGAGDQTDDDDAEDETEHYEPSCQCASETRGGSAWSQADDQTVTLPGRNWILVGVETATAASLAARPVSA
jgi:hypothetical protein